MKIPMWTNPTFMLDVAKTAKASGLSKAAVAKLFRTKPNLKIPPQKAAQCVRSIVEFCGRQRMQALSVYAVDPLIPYAQKHAVLVCRMAKGLGFHSRKRIRWTGIRVVLNRPSPTDLSKSHAITTFIQVIK